MAYHKHGNLKKFKPMIRYQALRETSEKLYINWDKTLLDDGYSDGDFDKKMLIASIGAGVSMDYAWDGSGATSDNALRYLVRSGYRKAGIIDYSFGVVKNQLDKVDYQGHRLLVYMSGGVKANTWLCKHFGHHAWAEAACSTKGHAWVVDGYKIVEDLARRNEYNYYGDILSSTIVGRRTHHYIHVNWGWGTDYQNGDGDGKLISDPSSGWVSYDYILTESSDHYNYDLEIIVDLSH